MEAAYTSETFGTSPLPRIVTTKEHGQHQQLTIMKA
jgi:hypothetical protein